MANSKVLEYILRIKDEATKQAEQAAGNISGAMKNAEKGSFALLGAVTAVSAATVAYGFRAVEAYNIQAEAEAKLAQLHKNREGVTDEHVQQLKDLASAVQGYGVIGDEAIITGQAQLATFQLSTDAIKELTPAMADMVAQQKGVNATGDDFVNIGNLMGKVMEGQVGALGRYGVSFSDAQEHILKTGNEVERAAALAEVLAQNYGGVNQALRDTFEGQMQVAKNTVGDFNEIIGEMIANRISPLIEAFNDWTEAIGGPDGMLEFLNEKLDVLAEWLPVITGAILAGLVPALVAIATSIIAIMTPLIPFIAAGVVLGGVIKLLIDALGGWEEAQKKVQDVVDRLYAFYEANLKPALDNLWDQIGEQLIPELQRFWDIISGDVIPILKDLWSLVGTLLTPVLKFLATTMTGALFGAIKVIIWAMSDILKGVNNALEGFRNFVNYIRGIPDMIRGAIEDAKGLLKKLSPFHRESPSLVDNVIAGVKQIKKEYESLQEMSLPSVNSDFAPALAGNGAMGSQNNYTTQAPITVNATINNEMTAQELAGLIGLEIEMRSRF